MIVWGLMSDDPKFPWMLGCRLESPRRYWIVQDANDWEVFNSYFYSGGLKHIGWKIPEDSIINFVGSRLATLLYGHASTNKEDL